MRQVLSSDIITVTILLLLLSKPLTMLRAQSKLARPIRLKCH